MLFPGEDQEQRSNTRLGFSFPSRSGVTQTGVTHRTFYIGLHCECYKVNMMFVGKLLANDAAIHNQ